MINLGWRNSQFSLTFGRLKLGLLISLALVAHDSRPKNLDEVAAQESTVAVLKKTLESTNVRSILVAPAPALCGGA
jgi:hypothetical protein